MEQVNDAATSHRSVLDDAAIDAVLQTVVVLARQVVGGADSVSITLPADGGYRTSNYTEDGALAIDQAQYDGDDGPCLEALRSGRQVQVTVGAEADRLAALRRPGR